MCPKNFRNCPSIFIELKKVPKKLSDCNWLKPANGASVPGISQWNHVLVVPPQISEIDWPVKFVQETSSDCNWLRFAKGASVPRISQWNHVLVVPPQISEIYWPVKSVRETSSDCNWLRFSKGASVPTNRRMKSRAGCSRTNSESDLRISLDDRKAH